MQAQYRRNPNKRSICDKRDVADDGQDAQEAHILGQEGEKHHCRGKVSRKVGRRHGPEPLCSCCRHAAPHALRDGRKLSIGSRVCCGKTHTPWSLSRGRASPPTTPLVSGSAVAQTARLTSSVVCAHADDPKHTQRVFQMENGTASASVECVSPLFSRGFDHRLVKFAVSFRWVRVDFRPYPRGRCDRRIAAV